MLCRGVGKSGEEEEEVEEEEEWQPTNKNPTRQCGEQTSQECGNRISMLKVCEQDIKSGQNLPKDHARC